MRWSEEEHRKEQITGSFHHRGQELEQDEIGHCKKAYRSVPWPHQHAPVPQERVQQTPVPAVTLPRKHAQTRRRFRPADGIGDEDDPVGDPVFDEVPVQTNNELHILPDRVVRVSTALDHHILPEEAEGARDDEQSVHAAPSHSSGEERPEVFDDLEQREQVMGKQDLPDASSLDHAVIGDPNDASCGDHLLVFEEGLGDPLEGVVFQDGVRVDRAEERIAGDVQPGVERVRFPAVLLVDDHQLFQLRPP